MYSWSHGLTEFLRRSNEDQAYATFLARMYARVVGFDRSRMSRPLRIADIGCGSGSKAIAIGRRLHQLGVVAEWQLIEQDCQWESSIRLNLDSIETGLASGYEFQCPVSGREWLASQKAYPDIAQFIHVPYDDESEGEPLDKFDACVGVKPENRNLLPTINSAIEQIRNSKDFLDMENASLVGFDKVIERRALRA